SKNGSRSPRTGRPPAPTGSQNSCQRDDHFAYSASALVRPGAPGASTASVVLNGGGCSTLRGSSLPVSLRNQFGTRCSPARPHRLAAYPSMPFYDTDRGGRSFSPKREILFREGHDGRRGAAAL